jgi:hypothetical protein
VLFGRRDVEGVFVLLDAMLALGNPRPRRTVNREYPAGRRNGNASGAPPGGDRPPAAESAEADADRIPVGV